MKKPFRFVFVTVVAGVLVALLSVFHPHAEEVGDNGEEPPAVSESELQTYIQVYSAMQSDHDLTIDNAIQPYHMSLEDFRHIERRIQTEPRLVERVREALLEHAKAHSAFAQAFPTQTPVVEKPARAPKRSKK